MTSSSRPTIFVHVGAPKSGTTYLQTKLWDNRTALRRDGFLYPGPEWPSHVWATLDLRKVKFKGVTDPNVPGTWKRMVDEVRAWGGPAIISHELLSAATPIQIGRAKEDLSFGDVHIVYTLRDMARTLPAAWQEWVKNREWDDFASFLAAVHEPAGERSRTSQLFWNLHDTELILNKWSRRLPPENVHVVTVPPSGSDPTILWKRFAGLLGLDPDRYEESSQANSSLAAPEATVLRRLNVAIGGWDFPWPVYDVVVKHYLAVELANRKGPSIGLPPPEYEWAVSWSEQIASFITASGFDVVGDLGELIPAAQRDGVDPDTVDGEAQADTAIEGMALLLRHLASGKGSDEVRVVQLQAQLGELQQRLRDLRAERPKQKIKRTLVELSDQVGWLGKAYAAYGKVKDRVSR